MKNRLLPLALFTLFLGFSCLLFADTAFAAGPDNNPQASDLRMQKIRSNQHTGLVDPTDVLAARMQRNQLMQKSTAALGMNWMHAGPNNWAGRSRVVLFDNQDPTGSTIYTGGVTGGVFKSINKGLTWQMLNTQTTEVLRVSSMTQTPDGTLYVGTGEVYCMSYEFLGSGIYRSTNGLDFVKTAAPWDLIVKLASDPNSGRLFAATESGLFYSDNGDVWSEVIAGAATDVVVGTNGTMMCVVDLHVFIAPAGNLSNLIDVSTGAADMLPNTNVGWIDLAIAPSDPNVMYASIAQEAIYTLRGVYSSSNGGSSWSVIFPENPSYDPLGGNGCYANTIEVMPNNPDEVLLGGIAGWLGRKFQTTGYYDWQQVAFVGWGPNGNFAGPYHHDYSFNPVNPNEYAIATDIGIALATYSSAGFTYHTSNKNLVTSQFIGVEFGPVGNWMMGGGVLVGNQIFNAVVTNNPTDGYVPPSTFISGTYGEWSQLKPEYIFFSGTGFGTGEPYIRSEDLGETIALSFMNALSNTATDYVPAALWETDDFPYSQDTVWLYARQGTIEADSTVMVSSMNCYQCNFEFTVPVTIPQGDSMAVIDPFHSRFFVYGTSGTPGVYMTADAIKFYKEPEWYRIGDVPIADVLTSMAVSTDLNYLWAGTENGKLYRFSNLTLALDSITADVRSAYCIVSTSVFALPEMTDRFITNVSIDPNDDNNVLVTLGNYGNAEYVYLTTNALDSLPVFTSVQGNLPSMPVYDGIIELHGEGDAILATEMGIFTTQDIFAASPDWSVDLSGMGDMPVMDLHQQTWRNFRTQNLGYIGAASFGQGLFYDTTFHMVLGVDPVNTPASSAASVRINPNPVHQTAQITYTIAEAAQVTVYVYDLTGRLMTSASFGQQQAGQHTSVIDLVSLPNGTYIVKVNGAHGKMVKTK